MSVPFFLLCLLIPLGLLAGNYDHPFNNPDISTIAGAPLEYQTVLPQTIPLQTYLLNTKAAPYQSHSVPHDHTVQSSLEFRVGIFNYPPHIIFENDAPTGPLVSFFNEYFVKKMNVPITFFRMPITRAELEAKKCSIDMIMISGKSAQRSEFLNFPEKPFHQMKRSLLVKNDFPKNTVHKSEDLFGLTIGWSTGAKMVMPEYLKHPNINLKLLAGRNFTGRNVKMLAYGRITGVASSSTEALSYFVKKFHLKDQVKIISLPEQLRNIYQPFSKCSNSLFDQYQQIVVDMERSENRPMPQIYREFIVNHEIKSG